MTKRGKASKLQFQKCGPAWAGLCEPSEFPVERLSRPIPRSGAERMGSPAPGRVAPHRRSLEKISERKEQLLEAFICKKALDEQTYRDQLAELREQEALAEMGVQDARLEELDVEGLLSFAEEILGRPGRFWIEASVDQRQRLQRVLFPAGLTYADGEFETAEISPVYRMLRLVSGANESEVSPAGFEPTLPT